MWTEPPPPVASGPGQCRRGRGPGQGRAGVNVPGGGGTGPSRSRRGGLQPAGRRGPGGRERPGGAHRSALSAPRSRPGRRAGPGRGRSGQTDGQGRGAAELAWSRAGEVERIAAHIDELRDQLARARSGLGAGEPATVPGAPAERAPRRASAVGPSRAEPVSGGKQGGCDRASPPLAPRDGPFVTDVSVRTRSTDGLPRTFPLPCCGSGPGCTPSRSEDRGPWRGIWLPGPCPGGRARPSPAARCWPG